MIGNRIGHYTILEEIGAGGMGIVYRARDTKLDRDVAIKALPDSLAGDPKRLARFDREAKLLASLNHANIAAIHGLERIGTSPVLILELVPGEDLSAVIRKRRLSVDETLRIAGQIADALEAAHRQGIIHRDLKPANVKVTRDGKVKVLDFGIAKELARPLAEAPEAPPVEADHPTTESRSTLGDPLDSSVREFQASGEPIPGFAEITAAGTVMGTASYMSPEQVRGESVDQQADIWSFGVLLFECLSGKRPFSGNTDMERLRAVLQGEPDWSALPEETPAVIRVLIERCLRKNKRHRLHDIGDARVEIEETLSGSATSSRLTLALPVDRRRIRWPWILAVTLGAGAGALLLWAILSSGGSAPAEPVSLSLTLDSPTRTLFLYDGPNAVLSPDGTRFVFVDRSTDPDLLATRLLTQGFDVVRLAGTDGARSPFFSPDGEWIGFFVPGKLMKVSVHGGAPKVLCDSWANKGGSWGPDGSIVFCPGPGEGLFRVSENGGEPETLTRPDPDRNEADHRWPQVLPDGKGVLYTLKQRDLLTFDKATIQVLSLETRETHTVLEGGCSGTYVSTGHLLFGNNGVLSAVPFDLKSQRTAGEPLPVLPPPEAETPEGQKLMTNPNTGSAHYSVSRNGTLLYDPSGALVHRNALIWIDVDHGHPDPTRAPWKPVTEDLRDFYEPRLSPDGKRIILWIPEAHDKLWLHDLEPRNVLSRVSRGFGNDSDPVWSPDGSQVAFGSDRDGRSDLFVMPVDGSAAPEVLVSSDLMKLSSDWKGRILLYTQEDPKGQDIWYLDMDSGQSMPFLRTEFNESRAIFSPDGRWVAYQSDESSRNEVYVRRFPGGEDRERVSRNGGHTPRWGVGGTLFYRNEDTFLAAQVLTGSRVQVGEEKAVARGSFGVGYDVSPDGKRLLAVRLNEKIESSTRLNVVLNWTGELQTRVPRSE